MQTYIAIIVFLLLILILVSILLFARKKLLPSGKVKIKINNEKELDVEAGGTLLSTLAEQGIYLPSACGGGGTCGTCKCQVISGGGELLPTETAHINRKMAKEHWRLGCQLKVKNDLELQIPPDIFGIKKWECEVVSNKNLATYIKEFVVKLPENESLNFKSGSYIQIEVPKTKIDYKNFEIDDIYKDEWGKNGLFNLKVNIKEPVVRAYSMANYPKENQIITLNVRIATPPFDRKSGKFKNIPPGLCSSYIFNLKKGDKVNISGPYGEFFIQNTSNEMMFIGGGAGMAPMRSHIFDQFKTLKTHRKATFWYGGRSLKEIFYVEDFENIQKEFDNFKYAIALSEPCPEDNWTGYTGFIHQVIYDNYLKNHPTPEDIEYYLCGPGMMIAAVEKMLDNLGVPPEKIFFDKFD